LNFMKTPVESCRGRKSKEPGRTRKSQEELELVIG
jgi:hypothetical protein